MNPSEEVVLRFKCSYFYIAGEVVLCAFCLLCFVDLGSYIHIRYFSSDTLSVFSCSFERLSFQLPPVIQINLVVIIYSCLLSTLLSQM